MPSVLSYTNAFPGIPFPQHLTALSSAVQSYIFPGAVQPLPAPPAVLSYTNAFPGIPFPNHLSGQSKPQSYLYPGAVQPTQPTLSASFITVNLTLVDINGAHAGFGTGHNP